MLRTDAHAPRADGSLVSHCPRCGLAIRSRHHWLTLEHCPRCLARAGVVVRLDRAEPGSGGNVPGSGVGLGRQRAGLDSSWGRDAALLLALLRQERTQGVTVDRMREAGIEAPAQAIYMLQVAGYEIDRTRRPPTERGAATYRLRA